MQLGRIKGNSRTVSTTKFRDIIIIAVRKEANSPNPASDSQRTR
jgi:hypothetical protein